jgi:hypothetical protein
MFMFRSTIIMSSQQITVTPITYSVPITYCSPPHRTVSTHHRYSNYIFCSNHLLISPAPHPVYCSKMFHCAVPLILITVQHTVDIGNIEKQIQKILSFPGCRYYFAVNGMWLFNWFFYSSWQNLHRTRQLFCVYIYIYISKKLCISINRYHVYYTKSKH